MNDAMGNEIKLGSFLVVATRLGQKFARVFKITSEARFGGVLHVHHSFKVIVHTPTPAGRPYMQSYTVNLRQPKNVLVVPDHIISPEVRQILSQ